MSINQIVTPLDSAVLETKEQYRVYFKIIKHAFKELIIGLKEKSICTDQEVTFIQQYCNLLLYSLEAFRLKYLFNEEEKMRIDLTESGFPNYLEFRFLLNDLELKHEHINKLPEVSDLKAEFLETILKKKEHISKHKLHQAASVIYYKSVDNKFVYKRFVQGKILNLGPRKEGQYMVSWSFYDVTYNRPFICFMYFDLQRSSIDKHILDIYRVLESVADRKMNLDMMAFAIDKKLPKVWPKKLKMIDLGPLHNVFAKDELDLTHCILGAIVNKTLDLSAFALSLSIDEITSKGDFSEGNFFNKHFLQIWETQQEEKYIFTPHRVMQVMYDTIPETLNELAVDPIEIPALKL